MEYPVNEIVSILLDYGISLSYRSLNNNNVG